MGLMPSYTDAEICTQSDKFIADEKLPEEVRAIIVQLSIRLETRNAELKGYWQKVTQLEDRINNLRHEMNLPREH